MMYNFEEILSTSSTIFQAYAFWAVSMMMIRSMTNELIPNWFKAFLGSAIRRLFSPPSTDITIVVDDDHCGMMCRNEIYDSAEIYLSQIMPRNTNRFKVNKTSKQKSINVCMEKNQIITDEYSGIKIAWRHVLIESQTYGSDCIPEKRYFEVTFPKKHKGAVVNDYLPFVLEKAKKITNSERVVKLYTWDGHFRGDDLDHPATFDTLAMDSDTKKAVIDDLDLFLRRRDYHRKVGKVWKREYVLYGPPGSGKSTLVAAMANYLKFDVYNFELASIFSPSELRRTLVSTTKRSIIVIEDIDCSGEKHRRRLPLHGNLYAGGYNKLSLPGLLNVIDGLWSSCFDERIIIYTSNYKEKLDFRPFVMDLFIHMSYCTPEGFKVLALNYLGLGINEEHYRFPEIENLIKNVKVTPAELADELMRSEDVVDALDGVVNFLKRKRTETSNAFKTEETSLLKEAEEELREQEEEDASFSEADIESEERSWGTNSEYLRPAGIYSVGMNGGTNGTHLRRRQPTANVRPTIPRPYLRRFSRPTRDRGRTVTKTYRARAF